MIRRQKKGSFSLSVEFIVMFILAITVFVLGMVIVQKIFGQAETIKTDMDESTRKQVETALMKSGSKVVIPINKKTMEKGSNDYFAIGIKNEDSQDKQFTVDIKCDNVYTKTNVRKCDADKNDPCEDLCGYWFIANDEISIPSNDRKVTELFVVVPKKPQNPDYPIVPATYTFNVQVKKAGVSYDTVKKVYVIIE